MFLLKVVMRQIQGKGLDISGTLKVNLHVSYSSAIQKQADQSSSVLSALRNSREDERVLASSFAFEQNPSRKINSFDDEDDIVQVHF